MHKPLASLLALVVLGGASSWSAVAHAADDRAQCVQAADLAQQNRDEGRYRAARDNMLTCSRDACPAAVRRDCVQWLTDLDASQPTIVLSAKMGAEDLATVKVTVDGTVVAEKLDGKPIMIDPGEHKVVFDYGSRSENRTLVMQAGQKNRQVQVVFADPSAAPVAVNPNATAGGDSRPVSDGARKIPVASFVLAGVGVAGIAMFAGFGLAGKGDVDDMRKPVADGGCAPSCTQDRVDSAKAKLLIGDVSLGVGLVAIGGAFVAYFVTPTDSDAPKPTQALSPRWNAGPTRGGAQAGMSLAF